VGQEIGWECGFAIIALASGIIRAAHYRAGYLVSFHRIRSDFFGPTHLLFRFQLSSFILFSACLYRFQPFFPPFSFFGLVIAGVMFPPLLSSMI